MSRACSKFSTGKLVLFSFSAIEHTLPDEDRFKHSDLFCSAMWAIYLQLYVLCKITQNKPILNKCPV